MVRNRTPQWRVREYGGEFVVTDGRREYSTHNEQHAFWLARRLNTILDGVGYGREPAG